MLLTKAFPFQIKAEGNSGLFSGRASVYGVTDSYGDVVMPGAFAKTIEKNGGQIVVLNGHNPNDPVGTALLQDSDTALLAEGQLVLDLPSAKDCYTKLQHGLVTGLSVGYTTVKEAYTNGARQLLEIDLWEISLCVFPANAFARVTDVKHALAACQLPALAHLDQHLNFQLAQALDEIKAGRVLSSANRSRVSAAADALAAALEALTGLLDETDDSKSIPPTQTASLEQLLATMRGLRAAAAQE